MWGVVSAFRQQAAPGDEADEVAEAVAALFPLGFDAVEFGFVGEGEVAAEGVGEHLFHEATGNETLVGDEVGDENGTVIVGLTEIGVATVNLLRMNRPQLVEVRSLWVIVGKHPPN